MLKKEHQELINAALLYAKAVRAESELDGSEDATKRALEELKRVALRLELQALGE